MGVGIIVAIPMKTHKCVVCLLDMSMREKILCTQQVIDFSNSQIINICLLEEVGLML